MKNYFSFLVLLLPLALLVLLFTSTVADKQNNSEPLNITLHDMSQKYGWKISDWFHYLNATSTEELQNLAGTQIDLSPLNVASIHGIWLLKNYEEHPLPSFENKDSHLNPSLEYMSSSQLYDDLEITAYLYGNSYLNVTVGSHTVRLQNNCRKDQVAWEKLSVSLGVSGKFKIEAVTPDKKDFLILDKITATQKRHDAKNSKQNIELKDMTPSC